MSKSEEIQDLFGEPVPFTDLVRAYIKQNGVDLSDGEDGVYEGVMPERITLGSEGVEMEIDTRGAGAFVEEMDFEVFREEIQE